MSYVPPVTGPESVGGVAPAGATFGAAVERTVGAPLRFAEATALVPVPRGPLAPPGGAVVPAAGAAVPLLVPAQAASRVAPASRTAPAASAREVLRCTDTPAPVLTQYRP